MELPELDAVDKINMKLDDIIKYEKMKAGVSHNMQFNRMPKKPWFKPKYKSQNWRLRRNGPNTPRLKFAYRNRNVKAFLERKWRTAPSHSVFHRLGWTPAQTAARSKLWFAVNYRRPQLRNCFRTNFYKRPQPSNDPNRFKKMIASANYYHRFNGLGNVTESQSLNAVNLEQLNEVLGGHICSVKENKLSDDVSEVTITRINTPIIHNGIGTNRMLFNNMYDNGLLNPVSKVMPSTSYYHQRVMGNDQQLQRRTDYMPPLVMSGSASNTPLVMSGSASNSPLVMSGSASNSPLVINRSSNVQSQIRNSGEIRTPPERRGPGIDTTVYIHATDSSCHGRFSEFTPWKFSLNNDLEENMEY